MTQFFDDQLRQAKEALEYARLEEIRSDVCKFAEYTQVDERGKAFKLGAHHVEWYNLIWNQIRDVVEPGKHPAPEKTEAIILAPREHGKTSTMVTILQYILGRNPCLRIKYVSKNDDVSLDVVGQVKKNIERNVRVREVFPNLKQAPNGSWSGSAIDVARVDVDGKWLEDDLGIKDASLEAYGVTSPATGGRADIIFFDDMIGSREAIYEPGRLEKITKAFYMDWLNIGGKRHIVIGTPWTPDDVIAQLSQNEDWLRWRRPCIDIDTGRPLWPERWPVEALMARKRKIGDLAFDLQFMLTGLRERSQWWTPEIINGCKDKFVRYGDVPFDLFDEKGNKIKGRGTVIGLDPAASLKQTGSYSCVFVLAFDEFKRKAVVEVRRMRAQPRAIAEAVIDLHLTYKPDMIYVENNATQQAFVDLISLVCENKGVHAKVPIHGCFTGSNKWNPEMGLPRMVGDMQNRKWIIPWGDQHHVDPIDPLHECAICQWIREMIGFPYETDTTDLIMSSWLAASAIDAPAGFGDLPVAASSSYGNLSEVRWQTR